MMAILLCGPKCALPMARNEVCTKTYFFKKECILMTKRILAVVMAIALALSMLTVNVFAASKMNPKIAAGSAANSAVVTWDALDGATGYVVEIYNGSTRVTQSSTIPATTTSFTYSGTIAGGSYSARVTATVSGGTPVTENTASAYVVPAQTTDGKLKVTSDSTGIANIEFSYVEGGSSYVIQITYLDSSNKQATTTINANIASGTTGFAGSLGIQYSKLLNVTVKYNNASGNQVTLGSVNVNYTGSTSGTTTGTTTGYVSFSNGILSWTGSSNVAISYALATNSNTRGYIASNGTYAYATNTRTPVYGYSLNISALLGTSSYYTTIIFTVSDYTSGGILGTFTYNPTYTGSTLYGTGIILQAISSNQMRVSWNALSSASSYSVYVVVNGIPQNYSTTNTYYDFAYVTGLNAEITVYGLNAAGVRTAVIGSATIATNGSVSYNSSYNNGYYWNSGYSTTSGSTVQGTNCYMVVGTSSTTVYLNYSVSGVYTCVYTVEGVSRQIPNITGSVFTIPVGASTSFSFFCTGYTGSGIVASATYTASASSSATHTGSSANANTPSSTKNLTLTAKSSSTTTVSWTKNSSATMYEVDYIRIGATTTEPIYTTKTSVDIPMGKSVGFEVYVYAYVNGRPVEVGNAIHKAGDEIGATNTTKPAETTKDEPKLSAYVTGFKGTVGTSGSITLAWNAASGNPNYEVYYKKSTASSWKRIYTTAGRALKVNKLTNGTSYDFKVVANGRDSGILTMTIGTTSSTKTAPDPDGSGSTGSATPVITSITGGTGTITVSWSAASGAVKYQVWVNPEGSTKYTKKATVDGTSATVTGLSAGSYKVRIKASKDGTTWGTFNDASCIKSDYRTVDVK